MASCVFSKNFSQKDIKIVVTPCDSPPKPCKILVDPSLLFVKLGQTPRKSPQNRIPCFPKQSPATAQEIPQKCEKSVITVKCPATAHVLLANDKRKTSEEIKKLLETRFSVNRKHRSLSPKGNNRSYKLLPTIKAAPNFPLNPGLPVFTRKRACSPQ